MSLNTVKYKGELLAEDERISTDTPGVLGEYKELRADALEADTLDITVVSESGTIRNFKKNDKVEYFRSGSRVGVYYLQSVTRVGPKLYTLSALSAVGLLIVRPHRGGIYTGQTVAEVVAEICGDIPVLVETVYRGIKLYGWLPIASARDSLVQVLFAIGAWLHTDENGTLRVQKLWNGTASIIGPGSVHAANIQVKYLDPVSAVAVTEHQYIAGTEDVTLFEGTAQQGDVIEFDEPAHTLAAEGFTVLESGANYAVLSAGTGKLTGKSYVHNRRVVTRTVTKDAAENVEEIADATLVSLVNSSAVAQRMAAYYACREQLTVDVNPAAEHAGHVVSLWNEWDKQQTLACIASRETKISGLLKSRTSALVGFLPPQPETTEYYDERAVLTGSGSWPVPEGARGLKAILIQAGGGGYSGENGDDAATPEHTANYGAYKNGGQANGGAGGLPGVCGKILQIDVNIQGQSFIPYSCGAGGTGGSAVRGEASQAGADGGHTTFGDYSSKDGVISNAGYVDPITGEVYAAPVATQGIHGGISSGATGTYMDNFVQGDPVVDEDGNTWTAGIPGNQLPRNEVYLGSPSLYIYSNAGSGGGAAVGASGGTGYAGAVTKDTAETGTGGDGANAIANTKTPNCYGSGGYGGHGGGGGGGSGMCSAQLDPWDKTFTVGPLARGGLGGQGGNGAPGCIILYYRRPKLVQSGPLVTSNNLGLLDSLGRRMIV